MKRDNSQLMVAMMIVGGLIIIAIVCLAVAYATKDAGPAWGAVGAIIGALATALNAPTGISSVIAESKKPPPPVTPAPAAPPPIVTDPIDPKEPQP